MRFSVELPIATPDALMNCALAIEAAGFDACFVTDHPSPPRDWLATGGHETLDPFVALSFAAAATRRLRLHTNCLIPAYRNPYLAAKAVATLDACSRGRVILGVAVGYLEAEFDALGVPFVERAGRLDETLWAMKAAWADEIPDNVVTPRCVQQPHPPIWAGGNSAAAIRRAIAHGDGWSPFPASPRTAAAVDSASMTDAAKLAHAIVRLHERAEEAGRTEPLDVCFTPFSHPAHKDVVDPSAFVAEAHGLSAIGVTWLAFHLPAPSVAEFCDIVAAFGEAVAEVRT
ncbi:MAG: TIGR03619 family F420-dependent LLM class oxidoreductase [Actinomycetota bacterium]|nr:TIGR03619 family F420-dependent LLM class oxidoreductase [Actinomycetota bacterium]